MIPKGQSEDVNHKRKNNTMARGNKRQRTNNDLHNTTNHGPQENAK